MFCKKLLLFFGALLFVNVLGAVGNNPVFRIKEYHITSGFSGKLYDLTLDQDLADHYFVIVRGSRSGTGGLNHSQTYARVLKVPGGKGDLAASTANNIITLQRKQNVSVTWEGVVTVVECIAEEDSKGFRLLDAKSTEMTGTATTGTFTSGTNWTTLANVVPFGGFKGGGVEYAANNMSAGKITSVMSRLYPSGTNTINWARHAGGETLVTATMTTFIVEWGSEWTVQHSYVNGNKGGQAANQTTEYQTATINEVTRANTWLWATGNREDAGIGDCAEAVVVTLGDGVTQNTTETKVAVGSEYNDRFHFDVYTLSHSDASVEHKFKADGHGGDQDLGVSITTAAGSEKFALIYNTVNGTGTAFPRPLMWARFTASNTITVSRGYVGQQFVAWVQAVNFSTIKYNPPGAPYITVTNNYINHRLGASLTTPTATVYASDNSLLQQALNPDNAVNVQSAGEQTLRYNYNGATEATITVNIQAPTIQILGDNPYNQELDLPFLDPKAQLINPDGTVAVDNITSSTNINIYKPQTKTIYYNCTDPISNQSFSITRTVVIGNTLLSKWKLDKGANDRMKTNNGTIVGANLVGGRFRKAVEFDGDNDYVDFGTVSAMVQPSTFTVSMRFKRKVNRSQSTNHQVRNVLIAQSSRSFNDNFEIGTKGTKIQVYADTTSGLDTTKEIEAGIQNNTWYHLVVSYGQGTIRVYVDGVKKATWTGFGTKLDSAQGSKLSLGIARVKTDPNDNANDQMWGDYEGWIDDVAIYQTVFADSIVSRLSTSATLRTWTRADFKDKLKEDSRYSGLANKIATRKGITVAAAQALIDSNDFDADGDGRSNLLEYAFGSDTLGTDEDEKERRPKRELDRTNGYFQITFIRRKTDVATDLTYTVERSTDLSTWTSSNVSLVSAEDIGDGLEEVTYRSDQKFNEANSPKNQYLRIKVETN